MATRYCLSRERRDLTRGRPRRTAPTNDQQLINNLSGRAIISILTNLQQAAFLYCSELVFQLNSLRNLRVLCVSAVMGLERNRRVAENAEAAQRVENSRYPLKTHEQ